MSTDLIAAKLVLSAAELEAVVAFVRFAGQNRIRKFIAQHPEQGENFAYAAAKIRVAVDAALEEGERG